MKTIIKMIGKRTGFLTVISLSHVLLKRGAYWNCLCDCGKIKVVWGPHLRRNKIKSCGCYHDACATTHGMGARNGVKPRIYSIWTAMKYRCSNPNNTAYKWYGGKGITVCKEWLDYKIFHDWAINNGYADNLTIDRKTSKGNYCPGNCQWITQSENSKKAGKE